MKAILKRGLGGVSLGVISTAIRSTCENSLNDNGKLLCFMFGVLAGMSMQKPLFKRLKKKLYHFFLGHLSWNLDQNRLQNVQTNEVT